MQIFKSQNKFRVNRVGFTQAPSYGASGFTLVEMVIVLLVMAILLLGFLMLYDWHTKIYNYEVAFVRVTSASRSSLQTLSSNASQAHQVLASSSGYSSGSQTLILQLPSVDNTGELIAGKWDTMIFYASSTNFYFSAQPDASSARPAGIKLLSDSLNSLTFTYNNADVTQATKVTVDMDNRLQVRNQTVDSHVQQDLYLKNFY